jgi:hypothetical protein
MVSEEEERGMLASEMRHQDRPAHFLSAVDWMCQHLVGLSVYMSVSVSVSVSIFVSVSVSVCMSVCLYTWLVC